jgi:hypothetical protein
MDSSAFDRLTRSLTASPSRRAAVHLLAGLLVTGPWRGVDDAPGALAKRKKRKKKKKQKLVFNAFGCVDVGQACRGNSANCCSGICQGTAPKKGKKDTSRCLAHNEGVCQDGDDFCQGTTVNCGSPGVCVRTTGNGSFCGKGATCTVCSKDTDCDEAEFGPGVACIVCVNCDGVNGSSGTACIEAAA